MPSVARGTRVELNYFNAVACLFVILLHILSYGITGLDAQSWELSLIFFPWKLAGFVVPGFLFCGAVKLALQVEDGRMPPYLPYIRKRIRKIYLPYLLCTLVYYGVFLAIGIISHSWADLGTYLVWGTLSAQFCYILITMQFYFLMPLWRWVVSRYPVYIALPAAFLIDVWMLNFNGLLALGGISFPYGDRIFPTYLGFWVLGLYVGRYYSQLTKSLWEKRRHVLAGLSLVAVYLVLCHAQFARGIYLYDLGILKQGSDVLTIFGLLTLCICLRNSSFAWLKGFLNRVHRASFSVFLTHCLFLVAGTYLLQRAGIWSVGPTLVFRFLVAYTLPFLLYEFWRLLRRLAGNREPPATPERPSVEKTK